MATNVLPSLAINRVAIATGVAGLLALIFIILFFTIGQPFGTLNDIFIGIAAILNGVLAWMLYSQHHAQPPLLSQVALVVALIGAFVVTLGSVLVIFQITGWYLGGLLHIPFGVFGWVAYSRLNSDKANTQIISEEHSCHPIKF